MRRFDVSRLRCTSGVDVEETRFRKQEYVEGVLERAREGWPEDETVVEKWKVMRAALVEVRRSQPDWFHESEDIIRPYLQERNVAYAKWLVNNNGQYLVSLEKLEAGLGRLLGGQK